MCDINWHELLIDSDLYYTARYNENIKAGHKHEKAISKCIYNLNSAWFIASLLHDSCNAIAKYGKINDEIKKISERLKITSNIKYKETISIDVKYVNATLDILNALQTNSQFTSFFRNNADAKDHGFASSVFIAVRCKNEIDSNKYNSDFIPIATEAVAIHNYATSNDLPILDLCAKPIATLLILCDAIQSWDRELSTSSLSNGDYLDKVEVRNLTSIFRPNLGPIIEIKVRYYLHSLVAKHRPTADACKLELIEKIGKYVKSPFNKHLSISKNNKYTPMFKIVFELGNQEFDPIYYPNGSPA